jgi:hypothetical protein
MKWLRRTFGIRLLWFIMAAHILNVSVDCANLPHARLRQHISLLHEKESFAELLLENVLGIANAVIDYDDGHDTKVFTSLIKKRCYIFPACKNYAWTARAPVLAYQQPIFADYVLPFALRVDVEMHTPPPKIFGCA